MQMHSNCVMVVAIGTTARANIGDPQPTKWYIFQINRKFNWVNKKPNNKINNWFGWRNCNSQKKPKHEHLKESNAKMLKWITGF